MTYKTSSILLGCEKRIWEGKWKQQPFDKWPQTFHPNIPYHPILVCSQTIVEGEPQECERDEGEGVAKCCRAARSFSRVKKEIVVGRQL